MSVPTQIADTGETPASALCPPSTGQVPSRPTLTVHDAADRLWADLLGQWQAEPDALLVLSSRTAAQRLVAQHASTTLMGQRVISLPDLWVAAAAQIDGLPQPMTKLEARALLDELLAAPGWPHKLIALRDTQSGLEALFDHLEEIEERADQAYRPQTDVEHAIQRLRGELAAREKATGVGYRSLIARQASQVLLDRPGRLILFGPIGQPTRYMAGLMKGLAAQHRVNAFVLSTPAEIDALRRDAGLGDGEADLASRITGEGYAARLFGGSAAEPRQPVQWVEATDEVEAAIEVLADWIADGVDPARTALVMRSTDNHSARLEELAARRNVPLLMPARSSARDSALGALLLRIAHADMSDPDTPARLVASAAPYPLSAGDVSVIAGARVIGVMDELRALARLGAELMERVQPTHGVRAIRGQEARAHAWLDGVTKAIATFDAYGARPDSVSEVLEDTMSSRQMRGHLNGVIVVNYVGASGFEFDHAVLCSLTDGDYPMTQTRSPFVSAELLDATPQLAEIDRRPEFVATVASAPGRIAFVRETVTPAGSDLAPSPYWAEALRAAGHPSPSRYSAETSPAPRRALQCAARQRLRNEQIDKALAQASRERLPRGILKGDKTTYNVTELELYLRCPYGWFVKNVLRPHPKPNPQAVRGMILHDSLADTFAPGVAPEDRLDVAVQALERRGKDLLSPVDLAVLRGKISQVVSRYGGPDWPFTEHLVEEPVSAVGLLPDLPDYRISGRVDRVDVGDGKVLVVDYKARRSPTLKAPSERALELQRYLYPQIAARQFKAQALGLLYVSLFHVDHEGSLAEAISALDMAQVDVDHYADETQQAIQAATDAIMRIEAGEWDEIGHHGRACPSWCPHHLISRTVT